jgi:monovalent cation:proton antiporter-2 (CPA2) family protein
MSGLDLQDVIVFLVVAGILVPVAHRYRLSPVLGFLLVGLLIGPYGLGRFIDSFPWLRNITISSSENVHVLAEFGVVFLLFMIGLELSFDRIWAMRRYVFGLGGSQVVVTSLAIGSIALLFGNSPQAAIILGAAFALSSTAVVLQILTEEHRLGSPSGRASFSILLLQDIAVVPILFIVSVLGTTSGESVSIAFLEALGLAGVTISAILLIGRLVIRPLFRLVGATRNRELFMAATLLIIILTAVISAEAGMSMALGAFLAGLLFAETEYRREIEVDIEPFKGLLLGVFFMSVGMGIDLAYVLDRPFWIATSVLGLIVIKTGLLYAICRMQALPRSVSLETALSLAQGGEFAFVVLGLAMSYSILPTDIVQFMMIVAGLSIAFTPLLIGLAKRLSLWLEEREALSLTEEFTFLPADLEGHVMIVGYGRVGQMIGSLLDAQKIPYIAIDSSSSLISSHAYHGGPLVYGDAARPEMLRRIGISAAQALVVTVGTPSLSNSIVAAARSVAPNLPVYARAMDILHGKSLLHEGATDVVPETIEASLLLGEVLLKGLGLPDEAAHHIVEEKRRTTRTILTAEMTKNTEEVQPST